MSCVKSVLPITWRFSAPVKEASAAASSFTAKKVLSALYHFGWCGLLFFPLNICLVHCSFLNCSCFPIWRNLIGGGWMGESSIFNFSRFLIFPVSGSVLVISTSVSDFYLKAPQKIHHHFNAKFIHIPPPRF